MVKNIVFDMGGVLIRFDRDLFISRLHLQREDGDLLKREVFLSLEWARMDRGTMDEAEAARAICERLPERLREAARQLVFSWDDPILPVEGMEELLRQLKEGGYRLFLLSNASVRQHEYWTSVPGHQYFEDTLISADTGLVKPQPEFYTLACRRFGIAPEESLFIDDLPLNAEGAFFTGMRPIVFHGDTGGLREAICREGVVLPDGGTKSCTGRT